MYLYNSATHKKEEFQTHTPGHVEMYTCGPTVYHFAHIGNLRSYIMEDVLEKFLRYDGYEVNRVMNITDVGHLASDADTGEDKMLKGAKREHKSVMEIAKFYTDAFFNDCEKLNIKRPDVVEPATNCIEDYIRGPGPEVGFPLGGGLSWMAYRMYRYLPQAQRRVFGPALWRDRQCLPPPHQRDCPVGELPGSPLVQAVVPCPPFKYKQRKNVKVQGGVPHCVLTGGEGL